MSNEAFRNFGGYMRDEADLRDYHDYQRRYAESPRESDKKSARLVLSALRDMQPLHRAPRILDIGCSTGNFLRHMARLMPATNLVGGDISTITIKACRDDPALSGIAFEFMNIFDLPQQAFDVIVANAVCVYLSPEDYRRAMCSVAGALHPGGAYVAYEWIFPGDLEHCVTEKSQAHPEGLRFWFRSEDFVVDACRSAGFGAAEVAPFDIPIDIPQAPATGTDADLNTYTKRDPVTGRRLMFRGALYQPWAHVSARRLTPTP